MSDETKELPGNDLTAGFEIATLQEGVPLLGHAHGEAVIVVRRGDELFAVGASCTHYGGPLAEGLVHGETVRCPWHHACFDLRTGAALRAPALNPIACYAVDRVPGGRDGDTARVGARLGEPPRGKPRVSKSTLDSVLIVGAGAAGAAAAETLRREGFDGAVTLVGAEPPGPVDRPNLSKDYLAGNAPEEWIPLRDAAFYSGLDVDFVPVDPARALDLATRRATLASGREVAWDALVLATGAEPIRLPLPGADRPEVLTLRTLADSRAIIARAEAGKQAVVVGASFIGLEVAASLVARGIEVTVVAPEPLPLARILGDAVGAFVRDLHASKGVRFHLGRKPAAIRSAPEGSIVELDDGTLLPADFVVLGVGVRPRLELAEAAGLRVEKGVVVDAYLRAAPGVFAAGDIARFPDARSGELVRIEHWVVAERMGQVAARNVLGADLPFHDAPFFWSAHYDVTLAYVGHAESWDAIDVKGDLAARDALVAYRKGGKVLAVVTVGRDRASLEAEAAMEAGDDEALAALVG
jgi:NADPH-dependent 2,4-dienoyl-CoA reductase/sulfur reductase-like enzyme/nitrite reductase/ring-hydroxylating ferredoxin subunit